MERAFYTRVRNDPDHWARHLDLMTDFWSSVMLTSGRYSGNPMVEHIRQKAIRAAHFMRWLVLFEDTASEFFAPARAASFIARAHNIARSLHLGMFYRLITSQPDRGCAVAR